MDLLATHLEAASSHKAALQFSKALGLASLGIEAFQFGLHVFVRQRHPCVDKTPDLSAVRQTDIECQSEVP